MLGALPLLRRVSPRGCCPHAGVLRLHPAMAGILPHGLLRVAGAMSGLFHASQLEAPPREVRMSEVPPVKLIPRNVAAYRRGRAPKASADVRRVTGNPVSTRLESGVGNCFPGVECDLGNLDRRFFPCPEGDISDNAIDLVGAGPARAQVSGLRNDIVLRYRRIATDVAAGREWTVRRLVGTFGPLGQ